LDEKLLQSGEHEQRQQAMDRQLRKHYPDAHKLMRALAKRFGTPQAALARLGMDQAMLDDDEPKRGMRDAFDELMRKHFPDADDNNPFVNEMNELLDEHAPHGSSDPRGSGHQGTIVGAGGDRRRPRGRDTDPPIEHPSPLQNKTSGPGRSGGSYRMSEDDERDDSQFEDFKDHLRKNSEMSEDEIEEATKLARDFVRKRGGNGHDRHADDRFPINRLAGRRGGHFGGARRSGGRWDGRDQENINAAREMASRIEMEPSVASSDRDRDDHPRGFDSMPTAAQRARTNARYGLDRIGDMWSGDGRPAAKADLRKRLGVNLSRSGFA
jgi:hypothetical protein